MAIQHRLVEYKAGDIVCEAYLAWDDAVSEPRPGIAIAHTWAGRSEFEQGKAEDLARLGYVGFAVDMYGNGRRGASVEENAALMQPLMEDRELLQLWITSAVGALKQQPEVDETKIGAMGFCFGGLTVLDLARTGADVLGVISFHGLFNAPNNLLDKTPANKISAKILCLHGYDDPMALPESMVELGNELTAAGADWQIHAYGGTVHGFTNPLANMPEMGVLYNAAADRRSWQAMVNFWEEIF
ncbi:MAG: dienelactone hydrolase family protein [Porticoccaceae bacterium]